MTPRAWANVLLLAGIFWASLIVALWLILAPKVGGVEAWHDSRVPQSAFQPIIAQSLSRNSSGNSKDLQVGAMQSGATGPQACGSAPVLAVVCQPARPTPSPSLRAVPRLAAVRPRAGVSPDLTKDARPESMTGTASTYGPGFDGYLALPAGPGIHVRVCGAGGCVDRVSNDTGPVPSLHRVADLDVADFEAVSGLPWTRGLCRVSVEVLK